MMTGAQDAPTDHLKYQDSLSEAKKIKLAFRDVDSKHAWHFFINTDSKAEVEKMVEGDPLRKEGYYDYEVRCVGLSSRRAALDWRRCTARLSSCEAIGDGEEYCTMQQARS